MRPEWITTEAVNTRRGPPQVLHQQTRTDYERTQNDSEAVVNSQCIFLRGFYVKERMEGVLPDDSDGDEDVTVEELSPSIQVSPLNFKLHIFNRL